MKRLLFIAAVLTLGYCAAFAQVDKTKPTGRACLAIMKKPNGDEEPLRATSTAGPNQKLVAHLDATTKAEALIAPFLKRGLLVADWRPQFVELRPNAELLVPKSRISWSWEKDTGPLEIYVLFFAPGSKESAEIRALVNAMQGGKDDNILKLQGSKLRELIGRVNFDKSAAQNAPKASSEVAGVMRMVVGFEWRDSARAINFSPGKPGALIFPAQ